MTSCFIGKISEYAFRIFLKLNGISQKKRPIRANLYIKRVTNDGDIVTENIEACALSIEEDNVYLYGWGQMISGYRCIPAGNIVTMSDDETGEIIARREIASWLINRSVR